MTSYESLVLLVLGMDVIVFGFLGGVFSEMKMFSYNTRLAVLTIAPLLCHLLVLLFFHNVAYYLSLAVVSIIVSFLCGVFNSLDIILHESEPDE